MAKHFEPPCAGCPGWVFPPSMVPQPRASTRRPAGGCARRLVQPVTTRLRRLHCPLVRALLGGIGALEHSAHQRQEAGVVDRHRQH
jgi:hypothetical protein